MMQQTKQYFLRLLKIKLFLPSMIIWRDFYNLNLHKRTLKNMIANIQENKFPFRDLPLIITKTLIALVILQEKQIIITNLLVSQ